MKETFKLNDDEIESLHLKVAKMVSYVNSAYLDKTKSEMKQGWLKMKEGTYNLAGIDVMFDDNLDVYFIESNHFPAMNFKPKTRMEEFLADKKVPVFKDTMDTNVDI